MALLVMVIVAYLFGSFPSGVVFGRLLAGIDVRRIGSKNIGASNVARTAGFRVAIVVAVTDILKGLIPVLIARGVGLETASLALIGFSAVLGHDYSVFLRFSGGKGVATTFGVVLGLAPLAAILDIALWVAVIAIWRWSSLASLAALALLPFFLLVTGQPTADIVLAFALFLLSLWKHRGNIQRLIAGTEPRFKRGE